MDFREALMEYEEYNTEEAVDVDPVTVEDLSGDAIVARRAAAMHDREVAQMQAASPSMSAVESDRSTPPTLLTL